MAIINTALRVIEGGQKNNIPTRKDSHWDKDSQIFPGSEAIEQRLNEEFNNLVNWAKGQALHPKKLRDIEQGIIPLIFRLGCLVLMFILARREEVLFEHLPRGTKRYGRWYKISRKYRRTIITFLGEVTYWRTYYYSEGETGALEIGGESSGKGFHPLDHELGLSSDKFSLHVISLASRLAAMLPFACAAQLFRLFVGSAPSERAIEQMVLGLGAYTQRYFEQAFPPGSDGEILIIMIDCKAVPTATADELRKRRGKRKGKKRAASARHRGRERRKGWKQKTRRRKGDKSKNGRAATIVVMYTLKASPEEGLLLGPINKKVYGSFAPKKHAFAYARREAEKRGFAPGSNQLIQFVSDGDDDFRVYLKEFFGAYAEHEFMTTLDLMHVMEYIWKAGAAHYAEGNEELAEWAHKQKNRLLESRADLILSELKKLLEETSQFGPGNKNRRKQTEKTIKYLQDNLDRMDYRYYYESDLELASGAVEGAVNHVVALRFDHGGMRWIVQRAESLLQLRCILINDDWDDFISWVQSQIEHQLGESPSVKILRDKPVALPTFGVAA